MQNSSLRGPHGPPTPIPSGRDIRVLTRLKYHQLQETRLLLAFVHRQKGHLNLGTTIIVEIRLGLCFFVFKLNLGAIPPIFVKTYTEVNHVQLKLTRP